MDSPVGVIEIQATEEVLQVVKFKNPGDPQKTASPNQITETTIQQLESYFSGGTKSFDLPIAQKGTEFQQQVWEELTHIPFSETITYLDLAKKIGNEKSIRAVGSTNGKNQIAIIVPCHRVIGSDGKLTGYAGGLWRKRWLIDHELKVANKLLTLF